MKRSIVFILISYNELLYYSRLYLIYLAYRVVNNKDLNHIKLNKNYLKFNQVCFFNFDN